MTLRPIILAALAAVCAGCHFSRTTVNGYVRDIDTAWIRPGETTRADVVKRIGYPSHVKHFSGIRPDHFRWVSCTTRSDMFKGGWIITPTFESTNEFDGEDILVRFDTNEVVTLVSRTKSVDGKIQVMEWREAGR